MWNYYAYTFSCFNNNSQTVCEKTAIHYYYFTFDHLFGYRSDFFNNLAILKHKNRCLSSSTNSVDLHFHEGVEKTKENVKNTKIENLQNGQEKYGGKIIIKKKYGGKINQIVVQLGQNLKNIY